MKRAIGRMVVVATLALAALGGANARATSSPSPGAAPSWLNEINRYREAAGETPVIDNPAWDAGLLDHLRYLVKTPSKYFTGAYQSAHTENPASPYYTQAGATEAESSDLALGGVTSALNAVDEWLTAPFHAVGMLRPQLTEVALAADATTGYAGLDVIQGLNPVAPAASAPILFPGPGVATNLLTFNGGEEPTPLETCGWLRFTPPFGLPLVMLLPQTPAIGLTATLRGPNATESTAAHTLCIVDENTYHSSDPVYGPTGLDILQGDHAVFLIPRHALAPGSYRAIVSAPGQPDISWSFSATGPRPRTRISSLVTLGRTARVAISAPAHAGLRCALSRWRGHHFAAAHYVACGRVVVFHGLGRGVYRFSVRSRDGDPTRVFDITT